MNENVMYISISVFQPSKILILSIFSTENAVKALTIDVIKRLQEAAGVISSINSSVDEKIDALDDIVNYVDDIDTAADFCKIGGIFVLLSCLEYPHDEIRNKSATLVSEIAQNNPYCQKQLMDSNILPKLMNLLSEEATLATGLRAVSCVVRSNEPGLKEFMKLGGLECLLGCLQKSNDEKVVTRAAFFLNSLCTDFPEICNDLRLLGAIDMITPLIKPQAEYNVALENLLSLLCSLLDKADSNVPVNEGFVGVLEETIKLANDKSEAEEMVEYCQKLLGMMKTAGKNC